MKPAETTSSRSENLAQQPRLKESTGWRFGKPFEDPQKTKKWGFVTARPSEYLIHVRKGKIRQKSSGQGATCFKRSRDAVAIIPTSLQTLQFRADQVTIEKVGVQVTGLAVYRIANPLLAYRVLNFSFPERAQEKLEDTLTQMLVGATRRLVANLSVDDCLQKRKGAVAGELIKELSPVVDGSGRAEDKSDQGWGVVIDTIEIQEVLVMSQKVFSAMQAPFRAELDRKAKQALADSEKQVKDRQLQYQLEIEAKKILGEQEINTKKVEAEQLTILQRTQLATEELNAQQHKAKAQIENHETLKEAQAKQQELRLAQWNAERNRKEQELEIRKIEQQLQAQAELAHAQAYQVSASAESMIKTAENLPALANAVGQRFSEVKVVQIGSEGNPFGSIAQAIAGVLELARGVGKTKILDHQNPSVQE